MKTAYAIIITCAIYCRLSREDLKNGKRDVSLSIENQRSMLESYIEQQGWIVYDVYVDDDVTGTTFDRPRFNDMMRDIIDGKINCVITKDLSRLGRNYIEAGKHRELFAELGVRYIALNDNHDSAKIGGYDITTPIKEIVNEMYAADISSKVRFTKRLMAEQGKFSNSRAPYGYIKSEKDKHVLEIDDNASHNVIRIFELYLSGMTARAIADVFNNEGILSANEYFYKMIGKPNPYKGNKNKWGSATIMQIIKNPVYYGAMANGKRKVVSFKNHNMVRNDFNEWIIVEDTHEPLIKKEKWLEAQEIGRRNDSQTVRRSSNGVISIFAGIIKCANCGSNLVFNRRELKAGTKEFFRCSTYTQKGKEVCPMQSVDYNSIYQAVLSSIQEYAVLAATDEEKLINEILKSNDEFKNKSVQRYERTIRESNNRIKEIDRLLQNLYEDKVAGDIPADVFKRMSKTYAEEQAQLVADVELLKNEIDECKRLEKDMTGWINRIKECLAINNLTRAIVVELIDRIEVSEVYDVNGEKCLDINISYKFNQKTLDLDIKNRAN